jgi:hypothetical protein
LKILLNALNRVLQYKSVAEGFTNPGQAFGAFFMDDAYPIGGINAHLVTQDPVAELLSRQRIPQFWNLNTGF